MTDLKIPKLNRNSNKYLFKTKLSLRRKSKRKLIIESFLMLLLSNLILLVNYAIPNKKLIFNRFFNNFNELISEMLGVFSLLLEIFLAIFIITSLIFVIALLIGAFFRIFKILKRKTKQITFK